VSEDEIDRLQRALHPYNLIPVTRRDHRCVARWWELEVERWPIGSFARSACELAAEHHRARARDLRSRKTPLSASRSWEGLHL